MKAKQTMSTIRQRLAVARRRAAVVFDTWHKARELAATVNALDSAPNNSELKDKRDGLVKEITDLVKAHDAIKEVTP